MKQHMCLLVFVYFVNKSAAIFNCTIPSDFKIGVASASYQIEGAWNEDGKGENIWDRICHTNPNFVDNQDNGDVACDSYHKLEEDVAMIKELGMYYYRFSLSWSRILPKGYANKINPAGVKYYKNLITLLLQNSIEPVVTIYHWDLPQTLQDIGGWTNPDLEQVFADYVRVVFEQFGDEVKKWITINEPQQICHQGYGDGTMAPGIKSSGLAEYKCAHTLLKAHARAYHLYDEEFRAKQNGSVSITIDSPWFEPADPDNPSDVEAAERARQFTYGLYANPVYNKNYPQIMIDRIGERSAKEGYRTSRLPVFTPEELDYISGTFDFMGLNMYTANLVRWTPDHPITDANYYSDMGVRQFQNETWPKTASSWLKVTPWAARKMLNWLKLTYNDPEIMITEIGVSDRDGLDDQQRIDFHKEYLSNILDAKVQDGVKVVGYTVWSLMDNFEWARGYSERFGLYHVDFNDPERKRTPKASARYFAQIAKTRCLVDDGCSEK